MKKFLVAILSLTAIILSSLALVSSGDFSYVKAQTATSANVETFLPSSSLELYDLNSPLSISYSPSGYMVVTEHIGNDDGTSKFDLISVYDPYSDRYTALPSHRTIYNVTHATEWNGFIFYLSGSKLYYVPTSDLTSSPVDTGVTSSNFFMIKDEFLITNTNNTIEIFSIVKNGNVPTFSKTSTHNFTTKNAFISEEKNIFYLSGGKLYCFETSSSTSYVVADVNVDVNYMTDYDAYVYLTSSSGIFKVEKGRNKQLELITPVTENANSLGYFANPQGITAYKGDLLIADPTLKSIQGISAFGEFTEFAITTESTADYRLTSNASMISLSENYLYALDDGAQDANGITYKRIVKTALDKTLSNRHVSISLKPIYVGEEGLDIKYFACSDTHVALYYGKTLSLYNIENGELKLEYQTESESVTSLFYLDGEFYYTDYALLNFGYNAVNVKKITLPTVDNGVDEITTLKLNEETEIKGVAINACVDVFGNVYMSLADSVDGSPTKLVRYSNGALTELYQVNSKFISFKADFAGNIYGLTQDQIIHKFNYDQNNQLVETFKLNTEMPIKEIDLNYRLNVCYALSSACVLNTVDDCMQIANMTEVGNASGLKTILSNVDGKFVTIDKNAKLFKVTIDNNGVFNSITPVTNPRPDKEYLIVDEIDNYYLVSYSQKFLALVRKTYTVYSPDKSFTSAIIGKDNYEDFGVSVEERNGAFIISNDTFVFSKPLFTSEYKLGEIKKSAVVYAIKEVVFNGVSMTLISDNADKTPCGYVISGYLNGETLTTVTTNKNTIHVSGGDGKRHFNTVLMILIISFTITAVALFIEKKTLFDKEDGNKNN